MKFAAVAASGMVLLLAGCALAGNPQPPSLWLPQPVADLAATREGPTVRLNWTMPRHTTDKLELQGPQQARFCWMQPQSAKVTFSEKDCRADGRASFLPDKPAEYRAALPQPLTQGAPGAVVFFVELENSAGKTAGPSNAAWAATGAAPAAAAGLELQAVPQGVVLRWNPAASQPGMVMRIHRTLVVPPHPAKPDETNGAPPPAQQVLEVSLDPSDPGGAVDRDAALDHAYRYTIQRVRRVTVESHTLELDGLPSQPASIDAKDVFPPAVPSGLVAVVDRQAHAVDLSWTPDTAPDLAGYYVYRRDLTAGAPWQRISGREPLTPPAWDDSDVTPGHRYAWSVSAVDGDGNESARSPEVVEEMPE